MRNLQDMKTLCSMTVLLACCGSIAAELLAAEQGVGGRDDVRRALARVDRWLEKSQYTDAWRKRLDADALRGELAKERSPDLAAVERWLERLARDAPMSDYAPVAALRS